MLTATIERLSYLLGHIPALIKNIPDNEFNAKPLPEKWSKKEILGHLIDSAANNHQRFVRIPFENIPTIVYDQNNWNKYNYHQQSDRDHLLAFWELYNRQMLFIMQRVSDDNLNKLGKTNEPQAVTLKWLMEDYVAHMEHHLKQIVDY
jgi:hypothetical protein